MERLLAKISGFVIIVSVASMTALALGYVCHYNFGLTRFDIRTAALSIVSITVVLLAVDHFGNKWRNPK